jgi:hypothetical protein
MTPVKVLRPTLSTRKTSMGVEPVLKTMPLALLVMLKKVPLFSNSHLEGNAPVLSISKPSTPAAVKCPVVVGLAVPTPNLPVVTVRSPPLSANPVPVAEPITGVTRVGDVAKTSAPDPVSSEITPASCDDVVAANWAKVPLVNPKPVVG